MIYLGNCMGICFTLFVIIEGVNMKEKELISNILKIINKYGHAKRRYASEIEILNQKKQQVAYDKYRLGVIGVTSSGKSTMINAILGEPLLSVAVRPSSSQLVSCSKSTERKATIYFENKSPMVIKGVALNGDVLKKYSDEQYNKKNMEHVKQIELSTPNFALSEEVLLVDSPGLDAFNYEIHEKLTMESLLPTIDFCVFVTTCKTNSDEKMKQCLNIIANYDCPVIIVQNMIDSLRPSLNGKKSVQEVAEEHYQRVDRIVKNSNIKNKENVRIVQISAKYAFDARTSKSITFDKRKELLKKSNYKLLVQMIQEVFEGLRPKIESRRLFMIKNDIEKIIRETKEDLMGCEKNMTIPSFQYTDYDKKINTIYKNAYESLNEVLTTFQTYIKRNILNKSTYSITDLNLVKKSNGECGDKILKVMKQFRTQIDSYCVTFNIDKRRLRSIESFGAMPELYLKKKQESRKAKESGLFSGFKRFFGGFFKQDWGYTYETYEVDDYEATGKLINNYLSRAMKTYASEIERWARSADNQINQLLEQYEMRKEAYDNRLRSINELKVHHKEMKSFIADLELVLAKIPKYKNEKNLKTSNYHKLTQEKTNEVYVSRSSYALLRLSENIIRKLNYRIMNEFISKGLTNRQILNSHKKQSVEIYCWDKTSMIEFLENHMMVKTENINFEIKNIKIDNYIIRYAPNTFIHSYNATLPKVYFVLFNTTQYGAGLKELSKLRLDVNLTSQDTVILVVQDFNEVIHGDGVEESIINMRMIKKHLKINANSLIVMNAYNPIYNLVAMELQLNSIDLHYDEVLMMELIQNNFSWLINTDINKTIREIIRGFKVKI